MAERVLKSRVGWPICTVGLALGLTASATSPGEAQVSAMLPGQNLAQQTMAQSIDNFCGPLNALPNKTTAQTNLVNICVGLQNNATNLRTGSTLVPTFGLDAAGVNAAMEQLNGGAELLVPVSQASVLETTQTSRQTGVVEARLSHQREWMVATAAGDGEFARAGQVAALGPLEPGGQILLAQNQAPDFAYASGPLGLYATGLGQFGTKDLTTSVNGYSFNNAGFVAGADYRITPQLVAGLAFGYTRSNTSFDTSPVSASGQSLQDNLLEGNIYATYAFTDALFMNAIALVGGGNNTSQRHIVIPSANPQVQAPVDQIATGSFGSRVQGVNVSAGYALPFGSLVVTPMLRFLYQHTDVDGFSESASSVNLRYGSSSVDTVVSTLGAEAQYTVSTSFGLLYPIARFHWVHQYSPSNTTVTPSFVNDTTQRSTFVLPGVPTSTNYADLGVGIGLQLSRNSSAFVNYDSMLGISHTTYNSFIAGVRFTF
jgi:outer membrane autotransporter protein